MSEVPGPDTTDDTLPTRPNTLKSYRKLAALGVAAALAVQVAFSVSQDSKPNTPAAQTETAPKNEQAPIVQSVDSAWAKLVSLTQKLVIAGSHSTNTKVVTAKSEGTDRGQRFMSTESASIFQIEVQLPQTDGKYTQYFISATIPDTGSNKPQATWGSSLDITARTVDEPGGGTGPIEGFYMLQLHKESNGEWFISTSNDGDDSLFVTGERPVDDHLVPRIELPDPTPLPLISPERLDILVYEATQVIALAANEVPQGNFQV